MSKKISWIALPVLLIGILVIVGQIYIKCDKENICGIESCFNMTSCNKLTKNNAINNFAVKIYTLLS